LLVYPSAFDLSTSTLASAAGLTALVTTLGAARRAGPGTMRGARDPARPWPPSASPPGAITYEQTSRENAGALAPLLTQARPA
jgi:hypothetical protein